MAQRVRAIWTLKNAVAKGLKRIFATKNFPKRNLLGLYTSPKNDNFFANGKIKSNKLHILFSVNYSTLVSNVKSVPVQVVIFWMAQVDQTHKYEVIIV